MNQEIINWLENPERKYNEGVDLYDKYGSNRILKGNLRRKETAFHFEKLTYELSKLAGIAPVIKSIVRIQKPVEISPEKQAEINKSLSNILSATKDNPSVAQEPDLEIQRLHHSASKLFTERAMLSNQLRDAETDQERKVIIDKLKPIEKAYYKIQGSIKEIEKTGKVPDPEESKASDSRYEIPKDVMGQMKALSNARSRLSKEQKKLAKCGSTSPEAEKRKSTIERETKFIKQLESIING